jgi:hypothetical protein
MAELSGVKAVALAGFDRQTVKLKTWRAALPMFTAEYAKNARMVYKTSSVASRSPRSSFDHASASTASSTSPRKSQRSTLPRNHENLPPKASGSASEPVSRSSSPAPLTSPKDPHARHLQQTIDDYSTSYSQSTFQQADEDLRMQSEDASTPTQSTAPSECGSQDSEHSFSRLRPPEPSRRRKNSATRTAGERDDGKCTLPSPPPPLRRSSQAYHFYTSNMHLVRPTTFWKNTPRSALATPAYSPSSHLIRRSTFVVAGIDTAAPLGDIGALCVESRTPTHSLVLPPETI